jgi:hypothetical protein
MEYKNTWADNRMIRKMENEELNMLSKFYNLKKSDTNCPKNPYLLQPERLHLTSYEVLPDNRIKLNVGYMRNWNGYVSSTVRMNYNQYILGTLYCEQVEFVKDVEFNSFKYSSYVDSEDCLYGLFEVSPIKASSVLKWVPPATLPST